MITEDYCSYEVSKLLKEKGFDEPCLQMWECGPDKKYLFRLQSSCYQNMTEKDSCLAPTHQMAMKWLRKVHNKHVQIYYLHGAYQEFDYVVINTFNGKAYHEPVSFSTYEDAVEAACLYALKNLI